MKKLIPEKKATEPAIKVTDKIKPDPLVLKGLWVKDSTGKDLILLDPSDQPYELVYAD